MNKWLLFLLLTAFFCVAMCLMYREGIALSKSISAVMFLFRPGKNTDRLTLDCCTGWVRHRGRFHESGRYYFTFDGDISKGDAEVLLLDQNRQPLMKLSRQSPVGSMELDGRCGYYLRWELRNATGKCGLRWGRQPIVSGNSQDRKLI